MQNERMAMTHPVPSTAIHIGQGPELSIVQLVAVARGSGDGECARVELSGPWRDACQKNLDHLGESLAATAGLDAAALADLVRRRFEGKTPPPAIAELLAAPAAPEADRRLASRALIYGVTTGFGVNKDRAINSPEQISQMQVNLLRSHACGVGRPLPVEVVRAMMLLRLRSFVEGHSCVRPEAIELLCEMLNRGVHPFVPEQGSVGSSGDLCPLAHLSLVMIGEGLAWLGESGSGVRDPGSGLLSPRPARDVLRDAGLEDRILTSLAPKEGLAFINGTSATTAIAALAVHDAATLLATSNLCAALSLQALQGSTRAFDPKIHRVRRHAGQARAAEQIMHFAAGSALLDGSPDVQDAYSLRCAPQVHGAAATAIEHVRAIIENEINAVTDNPLFFADANAADPIDGFAACIWKAYSGGNFHGEPIGMAADYLKIAAAELANISERRIQYLLDRHHNRGLPANLWPDPAGSGLNSGLMIVQYAAASLASENKVLAHPASVDSIPTSSNAEDHNAMSTIAARHARAVVENATNVLAMELLAATQALEIRLRQSGRGTTALSPAAQAVLELIRQDGGGGGVPFIEGQDREMWPLIAALRERICSGEVLRAAQGATSSRRLPSS